MNHQNDFNLTAVFGTQMSIYTKKLISVLS